MWGSMLQLPGRLLAIAGFQGEIQLSGQVLLKILAAGLSERNEVGEVLNKKRMTCCKSWKFLQGSATKGDQPNGQTYKEKAS